LTVVPARYGLRGDNAMVALAQWDEMDGFFLGRESAADADENPAEDPQLVQVTLRAVDWLDASVERPTRTLELGDAVLEVRNTGGHVLGDYSLWDTRLTVPAGSTDATLTARVEALPHAGGDRAWELWRAARPTAPGAWAALSLGEREAWLEVTRIVSLREHRNPYPVLGERIALDGRQVDDLASLLCALGEAIDGPGGYCGSTLSDLADCLRFAPRAVPRPQLVWRDLAVAEKGLGRYLDLARGVLNDGAIEVLVG
jgi:hypothetical protein